VVAWIAGISSSVRIRKHVEPHAPRIQAPIRVWSAWPREDNLVDPSIHGQSRIQHSEIVAPTYALESLSKDLIPPIITDRHAYLPAALDTAREDCTTNVDRDFVQPRYSRGAISILADLIDSMWRRGLPT